jgi:hypothetical protein
MTDIVERLRTASIITDAYGDLFKEAADYIERLRSLCGKADVGQSFSEMAKDLPRRSTESPGPNKIVDPHPLSPSND